MLQGLEAQALRLCAFFAQAAALVGFVLVVVAVEEDHLGVTFESKDVRRDAVEEPAVVRRHERAAGELEKRLFECAQGFNVKVV